ncbi:TonB family protein [Bradyrhizobium sp. U87765 SZCCT0131]|uniref:energy transducer TonB family protein n=1 Tax=unclassified Bradyrhizobium TaxID=2631580 RepID=UPI001BA5D6FC|nr:MULTISPECIES: energy transducer TonB [unclassified Bradyrhizobium]MBR1221264.1 TonB family protein [Bradyrhizobium sp. U87765 SZCCT0131]MBR1259915.1 TonB family protein [Bradyrhizobium sp. U87765 SZCCT0134]MBR1307836.1 TonB family protein [Bradyrhizobium sp. U87765 SZCCT0110]MBR1321790.1 TonB family protein [Bradyrhizobium sp. U87765 SZCCT0109]MBR1350102.1 TonB family protein [Bradyrhizobium sp. U87765 SZCCT0048]
MSDPRDPSAGRNPLSATFQPDDPSAWSSGEVARLVLAPTVAVVLFVGGLYWVRLQAPAGTSGRDQAAVVQVQIMPRPDPVPIPVPLASQPTPASLSTPSETPSERADPVVTDDPALAPPPRATPPLDARAPSLRPAPAAAEASANRAALMFQQALLRHVARFKRRYPGLPRGSVEAAFTMRRDGTLLGVWVRTSSGLSAVDKEAIETIRRAQPLPPIPSELPDRLNVQIGLDFDPS